MTTGSRPQRWAGIVLSLAGMSVAYWVPREHTLFRPVWALVSFIGVMRTADLARLPWPLGRRLLHVLSVVDSRRLVRATPTFDTPALLQGLAWQLLAGLSYLAVRHLGQPVAVSAWLARWAFGLVFVYAFSAGAYRLLALAYGVLGFITPPLHPAPAMARSIQEFWGERWNRTVSTWLGETFFRPLARRRHPLLGAFVAFLVSALVHAYIAWIGVGVIMGLYMLGFFLAQAFLIGVERRLAVRTWSPWTGHAWTVAWMVTLSPLFDEPLVRVLGC